MKRSSPCLRILACALVFTLGGAVWGQEPDKPGAPPMDAQMQAMAEMAAPGEHHEHLAMLVGEWSYTAKMWMPGAPEPLEMSGAMEAEPMLGGRFVQLVWNGDFMGQPFQGIGIDGYDKAKGQYTSTWRDNFGTYTLYYSGQCDGSGKVRTMTGTMVDPMSGVEVTDKGVYTFRDDGSVVMESWRVSPEGDEAKMMEMVLTRK